MRRMRVVGVALAAIFVIAAAASAASATKLTLSRGGIALAPGEFIEFSGGYDNLEVTTSLGRLECEDFVQSGFEGGIVTNSKATDKLEMVRLFGTSAGPCRSFFYGNAEIDLASISGPVKLRANGSSAAGPTSLEIEFEHVEYKGGLYHDVECFYAHGTLTGTNTATTAVERLEAQLGASLKLDSSRSSFNAKHICPKTAGILLRLSLNFNEEGEKGGREIVEEQAHA
jgi:hypothetical protein